MSDFLVNLALRGAGVPTLAAPGVPAALSAPDIAAPGLAEISEEVPAPASQPEPGEQLQPRMEQSVATPKPYVPPPPVLPAIRPESPAPLSPPATGEHTRELRVEHREIMREPSPAPPVEVREVVREKETVRERVVEREVRSEPPQPEPRAPLATSALHPMPAVESAREPVPSPPAVLREMRIERQAPDTPPRVFPPLRPEQPPPVSEPAIRADRSAERPQRESPAIPIRPAQREPFMADRSAERSRLESPIVPPRPAQWPERTDEKITARKPIKHTEGSPAVRAPEPLLRPAPIPEAPMQVPAAARIQRAEKSVEVKIGSIEIRSAAPPPSAKAPEAAAATREPIEGFEAYRSVRQYSTWFRE